MMPATLEDACGEDPAVICEWVYEQSDGNETLAKAADWLVGRPLQVLLILLVAWIAARVARRLIRRGVRRVMVDEQGGARTLRRIGISTPAVVAKVEDPRREIRATAMGDVLSSAATVAIWATAIISALGTLGVNIGPLLASAGIAGIALGFGAQSLVKDWLTGIFMLLEDQYGIGDVVDVGEAVGVVEKYSLRTTVLRAADGTVWHVPNGEIVRVGNRSQLWSVAVLDVIVAYDTDLDVARQLMHEAATEVCQREEFSSHVLEPPEVLGVERMDVDGVTLRLNVKTTPGNQWPLQRAMREAVKAAFDRGGVHAPFPGRSMWTRLGDEPAPGAGAPGTA